MSLQKGSIRVVSYLKEKAIDADVVTLNDSTRTSQLAADALDCSIAEIAKSIVFKAGNSAVVVVLSGDKKVNPKKVSKIMGISVENADADTVKYLTKYPIGGVPPFPHDSSIRVILDSSITRFEKVWAAAGTPNSVMNLKVETLKNMIPDSFYDVAQ